MRVIVLLLILLICSPPVHGWDRRHPVTPYGDFCPRCSKYGVCRFMLSPSQTRKALEDYYARKGLRIRIDRFEGRFVKARILDGNRVVDEIIFDRRTGRIRSIF